jgi:hypothetical protein
MDKNLHFDPFEVAWQQAFEGETMLPPERIWQGIEASLDTPPTPPNTKTPNTGGSITGKLLTTGSVVLVGGLLFYFLNKTTNNKTNNYEKPFEQTVSANIAKPQITKEALVTTTTKPTPKPLVLKKTSLPTPPPEPLVTQNNTLPQPEPSADLQVKNYDATTDLLQIKNLVPQTVIFKNQEIKPIISSDTDSNQYYDPSQLNTIPKTKDGPLKNIKVRAGLRVSN